MTITMVVHQLVVKNSMVYVSLIHNHEVIAFDVDGRIISQYDTRLNTPSVCGVDSEKNMMVCEYHNQRVAKQCADGRIEVAVVSLGNVPCSLCTRYHNLMKYVYEQTC